MVGIFLFSVAGLTACAQRAPTTPTTEPAPAVTEEKTATQEKEVVTKEEPPPTQEAASQQEPTSTKVAISGFAFAPATITIAVGTTVTWTNNDSVAHTVSHRNNLFDSGSLSKGSTFSYTFNQGGTFEYYCKIHPSITAKVIVGEQQTAPTEEKPVVPEGDTYSY